MENSWKILARLGELAEVTAPAEPEKSICYSEQFVDTMIQILLAGEGCRETGRVSLKPIQVLRWRGVIPDILQGIIDAVLGTAQYTASKCVADVPVAVISVKFCYRLAVWFNEVYNEGSRPISGFTTSFQDDPAAFSLYGNDADLPALKSELGKLLDELCCKKPPATELKARRKAGHRVAKSIQFSESETRALIDAQLRAAGWDAHSQMLRYSRGTRPHQGSNIAIAEWPTVSGPADYALFVGLDCIGLIEAKKKARDVVSDLGQAKRYSRDIVSKGEEKFCGGPWNEFKVPFLFAANGRPYIKQIESKSGVWFLDCRRDTNHPKPLRAWYSPQGLVALLSAQPEAAHKAMKNEPLDYLGLRGYQEKAIGAIEKAISSGERKVLVAMATGTGKTRVAIGLIYRLIKAGRFRRILFLVDRNPLGEQAADRFKDTRMEELQTFDQIYDVKEVHHKAVEPETKVHIATVQGVLWRMMLAGVDTDRLTIDQYDCIIVDEAHRGYTLDRDMDDFELEFRDEQDYLSKYRQVLEYFDAVTIGMTATPAPHTVHIFGKPVYTYGYREAVIDNWLCDHDPPHQITTGLKKTGIRWKKGETIPTYDAATGEITNLENIPDEVAIEVDQFNKAVLTENFNLTVCRDLVHYLNPDSEEKTLIYAVTDDHADMVVQQLKVAFDEIGCPVSDDAIRKITGSVDKVGNLIRKFKNEKYPNIAVTVDLLTTGIDVHEICNLVFIRRVRSRILYEQMLGRATRKCDRIGKAHFSIFDCVGLYEVLEPVTNMKPVVKDPTVSLQMLIEELLAIDALPQQKAHIDQIVAKLQRKAAMMRQEEMRLFEDYSGGETLSDFIRLLRGSDPELAKKHLKEKHRQIVFLDENRYQSRQQFISHHEDWLESHTRGYGKAEKPEDYLNEFKTFILDNINKLPALAIVCQRPRKLTRKTLRELKIALDQQGFNEPALRTAWREWRNEDIAADIISFIRRLALGDALVSHEERIGNAMKRIYAMQEWNKIQRQWLERIEKHLLAENVVERRDFDEGAFHDHGGYGRLDKIFQGKLDRIIQNINDYLYPEERKYA